MLTVADTVLLEQRRETADLRDLASLQHSYQEGHNHEATCGLCHEKDKQIQQLTAEMTMLRAGFSNANTGRMTAAGIIQRLAFKAWKEKRTADVKDLATAFFAASMAMDFATAGEFADRHICYADMHVSNSLFGNTKDGTSWSSFPDG